MTNTKTMLVLIKICHTKLLWKYQSFVIHEQKKLYQVFRGSKEAYLKSHIEKVSTMKKENKLGVISQGKKPEESVGVIKKNYLSKKLLCFLEIPTIFSKEIGYHLLVFL